jgi:LacI family gluconate utilization system Gnt-I transcriptional repressor
MKKDQESSRRGGPARRARRGGGSQITMADVARLAGTSTQTVSRVISRPELVTAATRVSVKRAIERLNYIPNGAARNLASSSSRMVAVIIPTLSASIYAEEVGEIVRVLEARGFSAIIGNSDYSREREERLVQLFLERRPDGMIITGLNHSPRTSQLLRQSLIPVVETWDTDGKPIDVSVGFSNIAAGELVGELFLERGARRVAFAGGRFEEDDRARLRWEGLVRRLAKAGIAPTARADFPTPLKAEYGTQALDIILRQDPLVEAIFFTTDTLALHALLECNRRGIAVPSQLAICGFGDYDLASVVAPALTTVRAPVRKMGAAAAGAILSRLDGEERSEKIRSFDLELLRRGSA